MVNLILWQIFAAVGELNWVQLTLSHPVESFPPVLVYVLASVILGFLRIGVLASRTVFAAARAVSAADGGS